MSNYNFENISIVGRIAYGIMCAEEYLIHKYPDKDWMIVFRDFWEITGLELWDDWMYSVIEIIPECVFEFDDYASSDFEYLSEEKYNALKKVYENTNEDVNYVLKMVYDLANSHAYSSIKGNGEESLYRLEKIIDFIESNNIQAPDIKQVQSHLFSERNGWGNPFNGTKLSKTIKY